MSLFSRRPTWLFALSIWMLLVMASCGKDEPKPVAVAPGAIEAQITPAGSIRTVTLTGTGGRTYQAAPDAATGLFSFTGLAPGTYTLTFETTSGYRTPAPVSLRVTAATTTRPVLERLTRNAKIQGTMSWSVGNTAYSANRLAGEISSDSFVLQGKDSSAVENNEILLIIPKINDQSPLFKGVGTYEIGTAPFTVARYDYMNEQRLSITYRASLSGSRTGTITITSYDPKAFTIAGTFEFTAPLYDHMRNAPSPTGSITVEKGRFNLTF